MDNMDFSQILNNENISEAINKLNNMAQDGKIPDDMQNVLSSFAANAGNSSNGSANSTNFDNSSSNIDFETIMKMKSMMEKMNSHDDPRANLLRSLKPYLKDTRKSQVEQYIKLFDMSKLMEMFQGFGGDLNQGGK